jgi:hypothetical protein
MRRAILLLFALTPAQAFACKCLASYPVCREVASSDVVFIGTVESVEPAFLDPWHWRDASSSIPVDEIEQLRHDESPAGAARLKAIYLKLLGEVSDDEKHELEVAVTHRQVEAAFNSIAAGGRRARLRVKTMFREEDDDDKGGGKKDSKKEDDDVKSGEEKVLTVWTGQGDCGIDFQAGETYLVYAGNDEETGKLETSICYRTKRLTDAGADLSYLHFFKDGGKMSSRLEGFVTSERKQERPTRIDAVEAPAAGLVVGLTWDGGTRYTRSAADGRFVFDGLASGAYQVSVYEATFPRVMKALAGPEKVDVGEKGCAAGFLVVPPATPAK